MKDIDFIPLLLCSMVGMVIGIIVGVNLLIKPITDNCFSYEKEIYCKTELEGVR